MKGGGFCPRGARPKSPPSRKEKKETLDKKGKRSTAEFRNLEVLEGEGITSVPYSPKGEKGGGSHRAAKGVRLFTEKKEIQLGKEKRGS